MFGYKLVRKKDLDNMCRDVYDFSQYVDGHMVMMDSDGKCFKEQGCNSEELTTKWEKFWNLWDNMFNSMRKL